MNTNELHRAAMSDPLLAQYFGGVFASDRLPKHAEHCAYIVNLDNADKPGSHWVAIFFSPGKQSVDYFDPYGLLPPNVHIVRFLKRNSMFKHFNENNYQSMCSTVCGQYCLYFLWHRVRGYPMQRIQQKFKLKEHALNDLRVVQFVRKKFNLTHQPPFFDAECLQTSKALVPVATNIF
jgi:hypothetical protein